MNIKKIVKQNGDVVYRTSLYLGVDSITHKKVRTTITGKNKTDVRQKAKQKQAEFIANGSTVYVAPTTQIQITTFRELYELWLETYIPSVKPQTLVHTKSDFNKYILPAFGDMPINQLTTPLIQQQVNKWSTYFRYFNVLKARVNKVLAYGVSLGLISYNPARDVILPKIKKEKSEKLKFLTLEQVQQFYSYLDNLDLSKFKNRYDYTLYKLALATGCRIGELSALEWSDIDFENRTISINKTYVSNLHIISTPKTKGSQRLIHIDRKTILMLKQFQNAQRIEFQGRTVEVVFFYGSSKYPPYLSLQYRLTNHLKNAGLPRITFHAFRHTHASILLNSGIDFKTLSDRLGHSDISMTMNIYSHLSEEKRKTAVSLFEQSINF